MSGPCTVSKQAAQSWCFSAIYWPCRETQDLCIRVRHWATARGRCCTYLQLASGARFSRQKIPLQKHTINKCMGDIQESVLPLIWVYSDPIVSKRSLNIKCKYWHSKNAWFLTRFHNFAPKGLNISWLGIFEMHNSNNGWQWLWETFQYEEQLCYPNPLLSKIQAYLLGLYCTGRLVHMRSFLFVVLHQKQARFVRLLLRVIHTTFFSKAAPYSIKTGSGQAWTY